MDETCTDITPLDIEELQAFRNLVEELRTNTEPWGIQRGGEEIRPGVRQLPAMQTSDLALRAKTWLDESNRLFRFQWSEWTEGREIFANWDDETAGNLDHATVRKLLTAIARQDRFVDGAWVRLFERGLGVALFERLLEWEELIAAAG